MSPLSFAGKRLLCVFLVALATGATVAHAQSTITIATSPLFGGKQAHPNVAVTASVEFPTVGAAYNQKPYNWGSPYAGYFDSGKCYSYSQSNGGYFYVTADADANHFCSGAFSGNFMNYVTMSAIDEFRYAMTGGNRDDENGPNGGTIIMRAYLPDGSIAGVPSFYDLGSNFPRVALWNQYVGQFPNGNWNWGTLTYGALGSALTPFADSDTGGAAIWITNCKTQVFFSTNYGGDCFNPQNNLGTFNVRISVCDSAEGPLRTDLCLQYGGPTGKYKPVGQVQINADHMRFASFGYLMDHNDWANGYGVPCDDGSSWNRCRYGGVLRSPMKYVGPTSYDQNQTPSVNTRAEINAAGENLLDPEGDAASFGGTTSGFINFINKFGSTGVYKRYDTIGEMYYEAIRYFQNLGPTPQAISGPFPNSVADFRPYYSTWSDPILTSCSANYIISIGDANTWDDTYLPGYNGSPGAGPGRPGSRPVEGGLDAYEWTRRIGELESSTASIAPNDVRPNLNGLQNWNTGAGSASYLVAGASFWANVSDIRTDLPGVQSIKTISFDVAEPSIDIHDRQLYLMGKYGGFNNTIDRASDAYPNPFWGVDPLNATNPAIRTNSEWADSSVMPTNYLLADSPQKLISGLRAAFQRITTASGNLTGAALTSSNLTYGSNAAYVATFTANWGGSVLADALTVTSGALVVSNSALWDAGSLLTTRCGTVAAPLDTCKDTFSAAGARDIWTTTIQAGHRTATPFKYADIQASGDSAYVTMLNTNSATGQADSRGQDRLNFLRGDRTNESGANPFRGRDSAMGDVVNSGPVYEGPPTSSIPDLDYQGFLAANGNRPPMVYVGANDGMLHAFRASDGVELFAYVPHFVSKYLNQLSDPGYLHVPYVDAVPKVQEAKTGTSTWKTVLLGGGGGGAQGVYALDVSDPTSFGAANVLFEFTDRDDPDFGNVVTQPEFAKLWVSGPATAKVYRYFAVVTGYNNRRTTFDGTPDAYVSTDAQNPGVLFLLALDHVLGTAWQQGVDYYKFKFPAADPTQPNGLGPVTLLPSRNNDRSTAAMYFGDLQGRLWRFNTDNGDPSTWTPALGTTTSPTPIFEAVDAGNRRQPITSRPEIGTGPFGSTLVFFGTGKYLGSDDVALPGATETEYALLDTNPSVAITRSDLVPRTASLSGGQITVSGATFSYSGNTSKKGWYLDFPSSTTAGERTINKPALDQGLLTFTTLTLAQDICGAGSGYVYQVNALTGLPYGSTSNVIGYTSTVGVPGPPSIVELYMTAGASKRTGETINNVARVTLVSGTSSKIATVGPSQPNNGALLSKMPPVGRISWREITNWNDKTGH